MTVWIKKIQEHWTPDTFEDVGPELRAFIEAEIRDYDIEHPGARDTTLPYDNGMSSLDSPSPEECHGYFVDGNSTLFEVFCSWDDMHMARQRDGEAPRQTPYWVKHAPTEVIDQTNGADKPGACGRLA